MNAQALTEELALRIGLAARVLPDIEPKRLMQVLVDVLGLPLTEAKLESVTVQQLRTGADDALAGIELPVLKRALDFLWGRAEVSITEELPEVEPYCEGDMPGSIRVAVASNGSERLDGHFGTCARFLIYQLSPDELRLVEVRPACRGESAEERNRERATQISDCQLLCVVSIGGPAAAKVVRADIHPVKFPHGGEAREVLGEMQQVFAAAPPPWLAKAMGRAAEERVRFERTEEEELELQP